MGRLQRQTHAMVQSFKDTGSQKNTFIASIPLWGPLGVFVLAFTFLMTNFGMTPVDMSSFATPPTGNAETTDMSKAFEARELLVYDPSESVSSDIVRSGYAVIETLEMKDLGIKVQRLRVPAGVSVPDALSDLRQRFPTFEFDTNSEIRTSDPS